jgi:hypothetical protein
MDDDKFWIELAKDTAALLHVLNLYIFVLILITEYLFWR